MGGMQECLFSVNEKIPKQGWKNNIKYIIWTVWILAIIVCFIFRKKEITIDFFYMTDHGISVAEIYNYIIYYGVIFLILIPAVLFGKRIFCHYFCWMASFMVIGTKIRKILHLPGLRIVSKKEKCVSCKSCNQKCPMGLNVVELKKMTVILEMSAFNVVPVWTTVRRKRYPTDLKGASKEWQIQRKWIMFY